MITDNEITDDHSKYNHFIESEGLKPLEGMPQIHHHIAKRKLRRVIEENLSSESAISFYAELSKVPADWLKDHLLKSLSRLNPGRTKTAFRQWDADSGGLAALIRYLYFGTLPRKK